MPSAYILSSGRIWDGNHILKYLEEAEKYCKQKNEPPPRVPYLRESLQHFKKTGRTMKEGLSPSERRNFQMGFKEDIRTLSQYLKAKDVEEKNLTTDRRLTEKSLVLQGLKQIEESLARIEALLEKQEKKKKKGK